MRKLGLEMCARSRVCNVDLHRSVKTLLLFYRPPMQTTSEQAKPAATMNTCGAMMVGSNQSKDAMNDGEYSSLLCGFFAPRYGLRKGTTSWRALHTLLGSNSKAWHSCLTGLLRHKVCCEYLTKGLVAEVEVCSKPPQLMGSSSGNMCTIAEDSEEAEQAGSVEQQAAGVPKPAKGRTRSHKPSLAHPARRGSSHSMRAQTGKIMRFSTRHGNVLTGDVVVLMVQSYWKFGRHHLVCKRYHANPVCCWRRVICRLASMEQQTTHSLSQTIACSSAKYGA